MTTRWKLTIEYDGTPFAGWQIQESDPSVQGCLQKAFFDFCGEEVTLHVAGRTDAGVHAVGQVAHVDLARPSTEKEVRDAVNAHMRPHPISVVAAEPVSNEFHARFKALRRTYCYKLLTARHAGSALDKNRVWHVHQDLDVGAMQEAAKHLLGHHDFSTFRASACQADSPMRTLDRLDVVEVPHIGFGKRIDIWAEARSFLHHQIRNITGTLKLVGEGKWTPDDVKTALEAKDRTKGGPMAPAHGLYFVRVDYPF